MREKHTVQRSIFEYYGEHQICRELRVISDWLDQHTVLLEWVAEDISCGEIKQATGRKGLTVESILRCAILKQSRQLSYDELVFSLMDSTACESFARLRPGQYPQKSALQSGIAAISALTWERINQYLLSSAASLKIERGNMLRIDSTVIDSPIHEPTDSRLLQDSARVLIRLLKEAETLSEGLATLVYHNHWRAIKRRSREIVYKRGKDKKKTLYENLISNVEKTLGYIDNTAITLKAIPVRDPLKLDTWMATLAHYKPLLDKVIDQTKRRIFDNESVPSDEKIFSILEEHTDIIVKGSRDIQYGHKLNLSTGKSGLILDVVIEEGNPADSDRCLPMLERHIKQYGKAPRQMAADGGYASKDNLEKAKALNVNDMVFHKKRGLKVEDMAKSPWVYRKLRNFRAGIEAGISCMKRVYGLGRCTWKGRDHFKAYVWSSVLAHNLVLFGRLTPD